MLVFCNYFKVSSRMTWLVINLASNIRKMEKGFKLRRIKGW